MTEIGIVMEPVPKCSAEMALFEEMGFDIVLCPDTQNLSADPYGQLALMANATTSLKIGTGVTHPVTRETAVNLHLQWLLYRKNLREELSVELAEVIRLPHISANVRLRLKN